MRIKVLFISTFILSIAIFSTQAQQLLNGKQAQNYFKNAETVRIDNESFFPSYIKFSKGNEIPFNNLQLFFQNNFYPGDDYKLVLINKTEDQFKNIHYRYKINYKSTEIQQSMVIVHVNNNKIYAINGKIPKKIKIDNQISLTETEALTIALKSINAIEYKWQMPEEEKLLKKDNKDENASYFPKGKITLFQKKDETSYRYSFCFDIYANKPLKRADFYIDAETGEIIYENNKIHLIDSAGSANTKFSGIQPIMTNYTGTQFRLRETSRGQGIETYNMQTSTNYGNAIDFTDSDNIWNNINAQKDEVATDAHWAAEKTWDYFYYKYKRNSIDGLGFKLKSYVHYDVNYANAFWNGQYMTFGDGNASWQPLVALDISGHEITHGLTTFTANLNYSYQSGALNEAYSDIFGCAIEFYAKPAQANWLIGENIGTPIRSMSNPNSYSQPDTYLGSMWYSGSQDNGGVHTNSGVLNYWFYLLSVGGSGINDNGQSFNVSGISIDSAAAIAFRTLTVYLTNTSDYADARFYSILSATDLFGVCSQKVQSTTNAFYAVGIGNAYIPGVQSNFTSDNTNFCQPPATVNFVNQTNNGGLFYWDFGDGNTSTQVNPIHTYSAMGLYNVKLVANSGSCGIDSILKSQYISISPTNPCIINMPVYGINSITACSGTIMDNGGSGNYLDTSNATTVITATGASTVTLTFTGFSMENNYDFLRIYDGPSTSSPLIGNYTGTNLPNGGTITSTTNRITLKMTTDDGTTASGFVANWQCNMPNTPPDCEFAVSDSSSCVGLIDFTDRTQSGPINWNWDFGDGTTSNQQDPSHFYQSNGVYNVKLTVSNAIGTDSIIKNNIITINKPSDPIKPNDTSSCGPAAFTFVTNGNNIKWFDSLNAIIPFDTGMSITTAVLNNSKTIYLERQVQGSSIYGGKTDNTGGGSYFNNTNQHYQVFNCTTPTILKSVKVYANSAGNRTIYLQNENGVTISSKTVNIPTGTSRITLDFNIPVQNNLRLTGPPNPNLYRNNAGCVYPYQIGNAVTLTKSSATQNPTGFYYFFYDWEIQDEACKSNRLPVQIFINSSKPTPSFTANTSNLQVVFTNQTIDGNTYLWDFGDGNTSTTTNPVHNYAVYGNYNVKLISYNACGVDSTTQSVNIILGINSYEKQTNIEVFPNPANNYVNVKIINANNENISIRLNDIIGKEIVKKDFIINNNDYTFPLNLSDFQKGMYILNIKLENKNISKKLIIK